MDSSLMGGDKTLLLAASEAAFGSEEASLLLAAAREAGVPAREVQWDAMDAAEGVVLVRHTWDYHKRPDEFRAWLRSLDDAGRAVHNSVDLILWNMEKGYLAELSDAGVPTPATVFVESGSPIPSGEDLRARLGTGRVVVKPTISATSWQTRLLDLDDRAALEEAVRAAARGSRAMIQAYIPKIVEGEWSLVYLGGERSHCVLKSPKPGEFRVQSDFGGSYVIAEPPTAALETAQACLSELPEVPTLARIDGVVVDSSFVIMEVELIEPDLFLRLQPEAARRLVDLAFR